MSGIIQRVPWRVQPQGRALLSPEFGPVSGWVGSNPFNALPVGTADPLFSAGVLDIGPGGRGARLDNNGSQRVQIPGAVSPGPHFMAVVCFQTLVATTAGILMAGKTGFAQSNGFMFESATNVNTLEVNGGDGSTFPTVTATGLGSVDGIVKTVVARYRGTSVDLFMNGVALGTVTIVAAGTWPSGLGIGNYSGTGGGNLPNRRFYMGAVLRYGDPLKISRDPWQIFEKQTRRLWFSAETGVTATIGRPVSDTTPGAWVPSTGVTLFGVIDEDPFDDADYISTPSISTCEIALNNTIYPGGATQTLSYRASSSTGNGITVTLKQGVTTIASWSHSLTGTDTLYTQTLTAPQIASITAGALSVTLTST